MPALNGQIISTITNGTGQPVIVSVIFWTPATGALRNATYATSRGNRTGALIVDNLTGKSQRVVVRDASGGELRAVSVPANGFAGTVAQLAGQGIATIGDLNGLTFDLT